MGHPTFLVILVYVIEMRVVAALLIEFQGSSALRDRFLDGSFLFFV